MEEINNTVNSGQLFELLQFEASQYSWREVEPMW